ncbi:aminotransferase class I/II-fold pyridoxal phosphate-dependent enzyme [uncultured Chitinophaga sp.]|uniref:aminotransferase class I/II-fold pyridoxal phosphate-dependent enzyme n=1 Tax=uncultured Chitinophaga sp. TaxID=339340 RepID=UPI0025D1C2D4|nr:aminotransferase class I/II-fold pyridoxal phosphate-dependent enzyme [uncultured Chitinophaga sp.]
MHLTDLTPGRTAIIDNREHLFFSGFAYLGMHRSADFNARLAVGLERYGSVFPSSRISNLQLSLYEKVEHAIGTLLHQQSAACFSSGYLAAQGAIGYGYTKGEILYAPNTHPALQLPGATVPQAEWQEWMARTVNLINQHNDHTYVIAADGVNPLTATINDFSALTAISKRTLVIIDDSHGLGLLGPDGEGCIHHLPKNPNLCYLLSASTAKAFSAEGGIVAGKAADIAAIKRMPVFTASTPIMPALAYALLHSMDDYRQAKLTLEQNIRCFSELTQHIPQIYQHAPLPVFLMEGPQEVYDYLLQHEVLISSFRYPLPESPKLNRMVLSALHLKEDLEHAAGLLHKFYFPTDKDTNYA